MVLLSCTVLLYVVLYRTQIFHCMVVLRSSIALYYCITMHPVVQHCTVYYVLYLWQCYCPRPLASLAFLEVVGGFCEVFVVSIDHSLLAARNAGWHQQEFRCMDCSIALYCTVLCCPSEVYCTLTNFAELGLDIRIPSHFSMAA